MISEQQQEQASLYALGIMPPGEQALFENELSSDPELRQLVTALHDASTALPLSLPQNQRPSSGLKSRIMRQIADRETASIFDTWVNAGEGLLVTDKDGLLEWANGAFLQMCGYSLGELRGKKPGRILQGERTDPATVGRMREAIRARRPITEELVNYAKDGQPYWVSVSITPILDDRCEPRCYVAIEHEILGREVAA